MPSYSREDEVHFIRYGAGASGVRLGLVLGPRRAVVPAVEARRGNFVHEEPIDEHRLVDAVLRGIERGNQLAETDLWPMRIVYFDGDCPSYALYQRGASQIVCRFASGTPFTDAYEETPVEALFEATFSAKYTRGS
jgi:hypothetical protein